MKIMDRCIKVIKEKPTNKPLEQYHILLCFCFLLDFFELDDFFEGFEKFNRQRALKKCDAEKISYDAYNKLEEYKKQFFHDSTRNKNPYRISNTLIPFLDYLKSLLSTSTFKESLNNEVQKNMLMHILKNIDSDNPDSLINLLQDYDSFINFFGGHIVQDDPYLNQYYADTEYSQRMYDILNGEDFYIYEEIPFPETTRFEELYSDELKKYDIYSDILTNIHLLSAEHTSVDIETIVQQDVSYWALAIANWDIIQLFYNHYSVWCSFIWNTTIESIISYELAIKSTVSPSHNQEQIALIIKLLDNSQQYMNVLNYKFAPKTNTSISDITNKVRKKLTNYESELIIDFCIKHRTAIKNLNSNSISLLYKLLIINDL